MKPLCSHLLEAGYCCRFLSLRFFYIRFARFVIVFRVPQITREGVQLYSKTVKSFPSPLLPLLRRRSTYCLHLLFVLF